jgi:hypothetical protein
LKNIKFVVKVTRGARAPEYVQRVDPTPIHMTTNRKLALVMGKYTAEDAIKSLQNSHCMPELESVQVSAQDSRSELLAVGSLGRGKVDNAPNSV